MIFGPGEARAVKFFIGDHDRSVIIWLIKGDAARFRNDVEEYLTVHLARSAPDLFGLVYRVSRSTFLQWPIVVQYRRLLIDELLGLGLGLGFLERSCSMYIW